MDMSAMKEAIIMIALIALIAAAASIALDDFRTDETVDTSGGTFVCGLNGTASYNVTCNGLEGMGNATGYLDTIGTIVGVAVLISIVIGAFYFATRQ